MIDVMLACNIFLQAFMGFSRVLGFNCPRCANITTFALAGALGQDLLHHHSSVGDARSCSPRHEFITALSTRPACLNGRYQLLYPWVCFQSGVSGRPARPEGSTDSRT
ncbi:hypothetical protein V8E53_009412 [Lactarius tabidus]